jgi:muramoyltetrapeptide carboxypeptidase LdcA involved in peptidoglycan recycling
VTPFPRPPRLRRGDTVAIVSPSWGGPHAFPHVYEKGLEALDGWGLRIREFPTARMDAATLRANPAARAEDINAAFADPEVRAIFASIGGDDSVRILPFLKPEIVTGNPKILLGYSDTSTLHTFLNLQGLASLHGPSIMAGFAQMEHLPQAFSAHVHAMLFSPQSN